jgi:putative chitinase
MKISDLLRKVFPKGRRLQEIGQYCDQYFPQYEVNTNQRIAAFLGQCAVETGGFQWYHELGPAFYFNKYEPKTRIGKALGNTQKGDGYRYRGKGLLMLTGRSNYAAVGAALGIDIVNHPELVEGPQYAVLISLYFWSSHNLNVLADGWQLSMITKRVNGGYNGLPQRLHYSNLILKALNQS